MSNRTDELQQMIDSKKYIGTLHPDYKLILHSIDALENLQDNLTGNLTDLSLDLSNTSASSLQESIIELEASIKELEEVLFLKDDK